MLHSLPTNCPRTENSWRVRKAFENGELINLRVLFDYDITPYGIKVDEKDAAIVREIFAR